MRISDWSSDVCSSDLVARDPALTCPPNVNAKGLLFEWCQKHKVSAPIFSHTTEGPSHMPTFSALVQAQIGDEITEPKVKGHRTKKRQDTAAPCLHLRHLTLYTSKHSNLPVSAGVSIYSK